MNTSGALVCNLIEGKVSQNVPMKTCQPFVLSVDNRDKHDVKPDTAASAFGIESVMQYNSG